MRLCYFIAFNTQTFYEVCIQQMFPVCEKNDLPPDAIWNNYFKMKIQ